MNDSILSKPLHRERLLDLSRKGKVVHPSLLDLGDHSDRPEDGDDKAARIELPEAAGNGLRR